MIVKSSTPPRQTIHRTEEEARLRGIWRMMKRRCENKEFEGYRWYGGKGISICRQWQNIDQFVSWALKNGYECGLTIDRIDPNDNYAPHNCRWITREENSRRASKYTSGRVK